MKTRSGKSSIWSWIGIAAVVVIVLSVAGLTPLKLSSSGVSISTQASSSQASSSQGGGQGSNLCAAGLPLQVTFFDALGGSAMNAPTLVIYQGLVQQESPSVSSSGVATTGGSYNTGTNLIFKLSGGTPASVTEYLPITVPPITCGSSQTNNIIKAYTIAIGAWTETVTGQGGTTFTSGGNSYFSQFPGGASGTETVTVAMSETSNNAGYHTSPDIINGLMQNMVVQIKDTGSSLSVSGMPRQQNVGTTRYWFVVCSDGLSGTGYSSTGSGAFQVNQAGGTTDSQGNPNNNINPATGASLQYAAVGPDSQCAGSLSQQKIGNNVYGGSATFSFGVAKGSLASGSSETLAITMNDYSSISYFAAQTSLGPNSAAVGNPQGSSSGTAFNLVFVNG